MFCLFAFEDTLQSLIWYYKCKYLLFLFIISILMLVNSGCLMEENCNPKACHTSVYF